MRAANQTLCKEVKKNPECLITHVTVIVNC